MKTIDPGRIRPRSDLILVKLYTKPDQVGEILVPDTAKTDKTLTLWEVVSSGSKVAKIVGVRVRPGDIVKVPWRAQPVDSGLLDEMDLRPLLFLRAEHVEAVYRGGDQ